MENNSICVLIATKNRRHLLERAVKSVFAQDILPEELIIINDGSSDDTINFLRSLSSKEIKLKIVNRETNGGVNVARHQGINLSESCWVAVLDDDDEFFKDAIKIMKDKLPFVSEKHSIVCFNSKISTSTGVKNGGFIFKNELFYDLNYYEMMTKHRIRGDCKPLFRRIIFDMGCKFPIEVNGLESYLFYLLARDGWAIRCYPEFMTLIHQEDDLKDRLSIIAPAKNPWPLLKIHFKQIPQHWTIYIKHPCLFLKKLIEMFKLFVRSILVYTNKNI